MDRTEQELVDAMRTGKLYDGTTLCPEGMKPVRIRESPKAGAEDPAAAMEAMEPGNTVPEAVATPTAPTEKPAKAETDHTAKKVEREPVLPVERPKPEKTAKVAIKAPKPAKAPTPATEQVAPIAPIDTAATGTNAAHAGGQKRSGRARANTSDVSVSAKIMSFVLGYVDSQPGHQARTVAIGRVAMHDPAVVKRPLGIDAEELPMGRYTAWGCAPCSRLEIQGMLERVLVASEANGRAVMLAYYRITAVGRAWLEAHRAAERQK